MADQLLASLLGFATLLAISAALGAVWANVRSTALEASNKRLTADNEYYLKKIGYMEPKVEHLERENETLRTLVNPATEIHALREQEAKNHRATYGRLGEVKTALDTIHSDLQRRQP